MSEAREELRIFVERLIHFMNLWTIYTDMLTAKYQPKVPDPQKPFLSPGTTMMYVLYGFFYSLIEDSEEGLNGFRVWRRIFPDEDKAIAAVEAQVLPFRERLRVFRNRLGFHGSRSRAHESHGFDLFAEHSGTEIWEAMKNFKALGAALLAKDKPAGRSADEVRKWIDDIFEHAQIPLQSRDKLEETRGKEVGGADLK